MSTETITMPMLEVFFSAFGKITESNFSLLRTNQQIQALEMLGGDTHPPTTRGVQGSIATATVGTLSSLVILSFLGFSIPIVPAGVW